MAKAARRVGLHPARIRFWGRSSPAPRIERGGGGFAFGQHRQSGGGGGVVLVAPIRARVAGFGDPPQSILRQPDQAGRVQRAAGDGGAALGG